VKILTGEKILTETLARERGARELRPDFTPTADTSLPQHGKASIVASVSAMRSRRTSFAAVHRQRLGTALGNRRTPGIYHERFQYVIVTLWRAATDDDEHYVYAIAL
jgi:hypothetical protein